MDDTIVAKNLATMNALEQIVLKTQHIPMTGKWSGKSGARIHFDYDGRGLIKEFTGKAGEYFKGTFTMIYTGNRKKYLIIDCELQYENDNIRKSIEIYNEI